MLAALVVIGVIAAIAVVAMSGGDGEDPVLPDVPGLSTTTDGQGVTPPTEVAGAVACAADRDAIATAEEVNLQLEGVYVDVPGLVAAGRIREPSTLHEVTVSADGQSYEIVGLAGCP